MVHAAEITGVVLAGGLGRRMGHVDKGLSLFRGRPMVQTVLERLAPQVGHVIINANQHPEIYADFGFPIVPDQLPGFLGPLTGLHAGMFAASTAWVVTVPCDSPFLPLNLVSRLWDAAQRADADVAVAQTGDQLHPVFSLCKQTLLEDLTAYLSRGERKMEYWISQHTFVKVAFDDQPEAFANINTQDELAQFEAV